MTIENTFILPHPPLIIPDIGKGEERRIQSTIDGFERIGKTIGEIKPETIIVISPHASMYGDYINISTGENAYGDFSDFHTENVKFNVDYDEEFVRNICEITEKENFPAGVLGVQDDVLDHGVMVPLYFINKYYRDYKVVRIGISGLSLTMHYVFGKILQEVSKKLSRNTVIIASGDLSHKLLEEGPYGFAKEGPVFDRIVGEVIETGNFLKLFQFDSDFLEEVAECGLRSFVIMAGALDEKSVESKLYSIEGPFGVGYATGSFKVIGKDKNRKFDKVYLEEEQKRVEGIRRKEDPYVSLARYSLEYYIKNNGYARLPKDLPKEMLENKAGVFVTLYKYGQLRGCIGTIEGTKDSIAEEILENAISSGTRDSRFPRVEEYELDELEYSVDILGEAEEINSLEELDPKNYGLIVTSGRKRGLLLPNIPTVNTPEEQLKIVRQKAGVYAYEDQVLERFKVVRHR